MIQLKELDGWSANATAVDLSIFDTGNITARKSVIDRATEIIGRGGEVQKFGLCLKSDDVQDINVYVSALAKLRNTKRKALFYVSCDNKQIIYDLVKATTFTGPNKKKFCPIIPNYTGDEFTEEEKFIIDFFCLKEMNNIFTTPFNDYAFKVASLCRVGAFIPNEHDVFVLSKLELVKM
jgi:hypothetical protein